MYFQQKPIEMEFFTLAKTLKVDVNWDECLLIIIECLCLS